MRIRLLLVLLTPLVLPASLAFAQGPAAPTSTGTPHYEVYAVRYATLPDFPVAGLVEGADRARRIDIPAIFWVVKGPGRTILVDTGFYRDTFFRQWKVKDFVKPSEAIRPLGLQPGDVTDIILTHLHWDHADGADLFPSARVFVQRDEYTYYTGEAWQSPKTHGGIEPDDMLALLRANTEGRVRLIAGDAQEILPGITGFLGGRHTFASQYLTVTTAQGTVVLASDNVYMYENLETHAPIAQSLDRDSNLKAQARMVSLASSPRLIVPGHDPDVFKRFKEVAPGIVRVE